MLLSVYRIYVACIIYKCFPSWLWQLIVSCVHETTHFHVCMGCGGVSHCVHIRAEWVYKRTGQRKALGVLLCHFPPDLLAPDRVSHCSLHLCWAGWSVSSWILDPLYLSPVLVTVLLATPRLHVDPPVPTKPFSRSELD